MKTDFQMVRLITLLLLVLTTMSTKSQDLYFPPSNGNSWETLSTEELQWNTDALPDLFHYLEDIDTKAFILLKDGKIVLEQYFNGFSQEDEWYWASAGKSLTAFMTGLAQQEGYLNIQEPVNKYLGAGWTSLTPAQENDIRVFHQLTMTTGLDDGVTNSDCTLPACLSYLAAPGTRWSYHNAPYTLIQKVIAEATEKTFNDYIDEKLKSVTGIEAEFRNIFFNKICFSNPRSMARFGLLVLNKGVWDNTPVLSDLNYYNEMIQSSSELNPSYGYLWWLNGQSTYMLPTVQFVFQGPLFPDAPQDMFSALGLNGQIINIVPSQNLVMIRMGNAPEDGGITPNMNNEIWQYLNAVIDHQVSIDNPDNPHSTLKLSPNPVNGFLKVEGDRNGYIFISDMKGNVIKSLFHKGQSIIQTADFPKGTYILYHQYLGARKFMVQ